MQWQLCCSEKAAWVAEGRLQDGAGGALVREGGQVTCEEAQEKWWFIADGEDNGDHFHASSDDGGGKSDNGDKEQNYFDANSEVKKEYSKKQDQVNNADSAIIFLINHWSVKVVWLVNG